MDSTIDGFLLTVNRYSFVIITMSETWLKQNDLLLEHVTIPFGRDDTNSQADDVQTFLFSAQILLPATNHV